MTYGEKMADELVKYIDYIKKKLLYIANGEIDAYVKALKIVEDGGDIPELKMPKMSAVLQRILADMLRMEIGKQNEIEVGKRKGEKDLKPITIRVIDVKEEKPALTGGGEGDDVVGGSSGVAEADGCDVDTSTSDVCKG